VLLLPCVCELNSYEGDFEVRIRMGKHLGIVCMCVESELKGLGNPSVDAG